MKKLYEKNNCLVNVSSSLLRHYGIEPFHPSLPALDRVLDKTDKKICLVLLDGLGKSIREVYSQECQYLNRHRLTSITSVYPPTTAAATTSLLTDRFPVETGWLGWTVQFPFYDRSITMFADKFHEEPIEDTPKKVTDFLPVETVFSFLHQKGVKAYDLRAFDLEEKTIPYFFEKTEKVLKDHDFVYAYQCEPDSSLHKYGVGSPALKPILRELISGLESLIRNHPETLFLVLADYGHKNGIDHRIDEHEDFFSLLRIPHFACEGRTAFFYVKEGKEHEFETLAKRYYGKYFYILSKEEVIENHVFGIGAPHSMFTSLLGDYVFLSKGEHVFLQASEEKKMISYHAGTSKEEREIDLSVFNW